MEPTLVVKKRGRPASGIVKHFWAKRLTDEQVKLVEAALSGAPAAPVVDAEVADLRRQVEMLTAGALVDARRLEDLELEVADLTERLHRCSIATDDQKARWWMAKFLELEASLKHSRSEFDQEAT